MSIRFSSLPYEQTRSFSPLVCDYLSASDNLKQFYRFGTDKSGLEKALTERKNHQPDREVLTAVLHDQYAGMRAHKRVKENLELLKQENTFTVCTAHQPNLMTGYLYFVYKILHAIKLAEELTTSFPGHRFVPVYYMGSEDNDLDELGAFRYNNRKFVWNGGGQKGAVGRMKTETLKPLLDELFNIMGPPGTNCDELKKILSDAYLQQPTIGKATQFLVNELFGKYGLIVIDPDDRRLKASFADVIKDDLLHQTAHDLVSTQIAALASRYKVQAQPRPINLFYLKDTLRERIEEHDGIWRVVNTDIRWNEEQLLRELDDFPERFSPNVILRGVFQETILPNIAFIGGGAEVAYWLQLMPVFDHYRVFYPSIHLRQSVLWIENRQAKMRTQLDISITDLFKPETELVHDFIRTNSSDDWQTTTEMHNIDQALLQLKQKAIRLDPTLKASAEAALAKMRHQVEVLEKKMLRAEKRKMQQVVEQIGKLKNALFPGNGLQERIENFLHYYLTYGPIFFDMLKDHIEPLKHEFLVAEED